VDRKTWHSVINWLIDFFNIYNVNYIFLSDIILDISIQLINNESFLFFMRYRTVFFQFLNERCKRIICFVMLHPSSRLSKNDNINIFLMIDNICKLKKKINSSLSKSRYYT